jgi:hypothetical protein
MRPALSVSLLLALSLAFVGSAQAQEAAEVGAEASPEVSVTAPASSEVAVPAATWGALVLSFGGDATDAMNAEARDGATAGLLDQGFTVLAEAEVAARVPPSRLRDATSVDQLRAIAVELGAESVVTVAVWTSGGAADSVIVSVAPARVADGETARSYSGNQSVTEDGLGVAARTAALGALERRTRAAMLGGGSGRVSVETRDPDPEEEIVAPVEDDPWAETPRGESGDFATLFGIIGPGLLLAIGGAGIGLGIYALLDENCTQRGPETDVCLMGDAPNIGVGVLLLIGGVLAAGGAAAWWITGATAQPQARVDGITLRDGGMLRLSGVF